MLYFSDSEKVEIIQNFTKARHNFTEAIKANSLSKEVEDLLKYWTFRMEQLTFVIEEEIKA